MSVTDTLKIIASPDWMADGLCGNGDYDPDDWYPEPGDDYGTKVERAQRVCRICPVIAKCLRWAYEEDDTWAVLGGMTAKQRSRVKNRITRKRNEWKAQRNRSVCV